MTVLALAGWYPWCVWRSREGGQTDEECGDPSLQRYCQYTAGDVGGYRAGVSFFFPLRVNFY